MLALLCLSSVVLRDGCLFIQDKQRKWAEEQRELYQQQAQAKAQNLRYEDELARKRMQVKEQFFFTCNLDEFSTSLVL